MHLTTSRSVIGRAIVWTNNTHCTVDTSEYPTGQAMSRDSTKSDLGDGLYILDITFSFFSTQHS